MKELLHKQTSHQVDALITTASGSYIFHGLKGMGKTHVALEISRRLNCTGDTPTICTSCIQHAAGSWPDLIIIKPEDKPSILIEQVRVLGQALSLSLYNSLGRRVVIIDGANALTVDAQNALLKLLEEPPFQTIFILVTDQIDSLLPTVRSRCAEIYFPALSAEPITSMLVEHFHLDPAAARDLAVASDGAPAIAVMLATSPDAAKERLELQKIADTITSKGVFDRLLTAKVLLDSKADLARFGRLLHQRCIMTLTSDTVYDPAGVSRLEALERFRKSFQAKVAPRVALERLMLEL
ncbi:MAG TPA: AAA family ATPase [Candidatus Saccharimonadia bacterium]|nr:AAA family ATPase [Candidatus Saccharimonadia bacterium]